MDVTTLFSYSRSVIPNRGAVEIVYVGVPPNIYENLSKQPLKHSLIRSLLLSSRKLLASKTDVLKYSLITASFLALYKIVFQQFY